MARGRKAADPDDPVAQEFRQVIGRRIRAARKRAGLTQDQLAMAAGMSKAHIFELETRGGNPSCQALLTLAGVLKIGVRDLLPETPHDRVTAPAVEELAQELARYSSDLEALGRLHNGAQVLRDMIAALLARLDAAPATKANGD